MNKLKWFCILLLGSTAQAAMMRPLDPLNSIEASISSQDLTRIAVKEDRILNVFGSSDEYVLEADEDQGQVFIRPLIFHKPISLTLTTEAGHTQDLRLVPKDQAPEALILKTDEKDKQKLSQSSITRNEVETLLHACQEGRIPLGYKVAPLDLNTLKSSPLLIREIRGEKLRGLTYEVSNPSKISLILSEEALVKSLHLIKPHIIAVLMTHKTLTPGEKTYVHAVAKLPLGH